MKPFCEESQLPLGQSCSHSAFPFLALFPAPFSLSLHFFLSILSLNYLYALVHSTLSFIPYVCLFSSSPSLVLIPVRTPPWVTCRCLCYRHLNRPLPYKVSSSGFDCIINSTEIQSNFRSPVRWGMSRYPFKNEGQMVTFRPS